MRCFALLAPGTRAGLKRLLFTTERQRGHSFAHARTHHGRSVAKAREPGRARGQKGGWQGGREGGGVGGGPILSKGRAYLFGENSGGDAAAEGRQKDATREAAAESELRRHCVAAGAIIRAATALLVLRAAAFWREAVVILAEATAAEEFVFFPIGDGGSGLQDDGVGHMFFEQDAFAVGRRGGTLAPCAPLRHRAWRLG